MADKRIAKDRQGYPIDLSRPIVTDQDGVHTELSVTDRIGDKWTNFPSVWGGKRLDPKDPAQYDEIRRNVDAAKAEGWRFPEFDSLEQAEAAAADRSKYIGKLRQKEIRAAEQRMWEEEAAQRGKGKE